MFKKTNFTRLKNDAEYRNSKIRTNQVQMFWAINALIAFMVVSSVRAIINENISVVLFHIGLIFCFGIIASCIANCSLRKPFTAFYECLSIYKKGYQAIFYKPNL